MTPAAIIAAAWDAERNEYEMFRSGMPQGDFTEYKLQTNEYPTTIVMIGRMEACQAYLDTLCAAAVERALAEAGYVIVSMR
jgi:hypothetical protein